MKHRLILSTAWLFMAVVAFSSNGAGEIISASPSQTVRGQITKIDGHTYVVRDPSGKEVTLRVDSSTMMMEGTQLREGDTITADVTAKGQASYIIPGPRPMDGQAAPRTAVPSPNVERDPRVP